MAGNELRGVPSREAQRLALLEAEAEALRAYDAGQPANRVVVGDDEQMVSVIPWLRTYLAAKAYERRTRGRTLEVDKLLAAAEALMAKGQPLTTGNNGRGPAVVAEALRVPLDTARNLCRRLAAACKRVGAV